MEYRTLGRSGLKVSRICLGAMMFGAQTDEETSRRIIGEARAAGINFIDTADAYSLGGSERVVGRAIAPHRHDWVLATKFAAPMTDGRNSAGLSRKWMLKAVRDSLERLGTDYIDVYYCHREDPATPLAETVSAMGDLIRAGAIRYWGLSNFRSWRMAEICAICDRLGIDRPIVIQPYYNAMNRMPEVELLPASGYLGLGVVPYSPLARGVLTGKYAPGAAPAEGTRAARADKRMMETEWREESLVIARKFVEHARLKNCSAGQFATAWVLANPFVTSVIAGPRTEEQWRDYLGALEVSIDAGDEAFVDALVAPGHPSTPGYSDPAYPLEGRPVRR